MNIYNHTKAEKLPLLKKYVEIAHFVRLSLPAVLMIVPSARTTSKLITFSRIVPYLDIEEVNQIRGGQKLAQLIRGNL